jgi:hypothetical protein
MDCTLVRLEAGSAVQVLGLALSDVPARIEYVLTISQSGDGPDSTLSEVGGVDVLPDIPVAFGHTRVPRGTPQIDAHLVVTWPNGTIECDLVQAPDDA